MEAVLGAVATTVAPKLIEMGTDAVTNLITGSGESSDTTNTNMPNCSAGMQAEATDSAISDMHAPPVDVRLAADPVPMVSQEKPYRTTKPMVKREKMSVTPVRQGVGTNRYDLFEESATRVIKQRLSLNPSTYYGYDDAIIGALNQQNTGKKWTANSDASPGDTVQLNLDGVTQPFVSGAYTLLSLGGTETSLLDGVYTLETLAYSEGKVVLPRRHFVTYVVANGKYLSVTVEGAIIAGDKPIKAGDALYLRFVTVGPPNHESINYLANGPTDIFTNLSAVDAHTFNAYEAYSIDSYRIDLVDSANWLETDTGILVYYVGDPDRFPVYGFSHNMINHTKLNTVLPVLTHEPHLQTVKLFKAGYNLSFELPIPKNRFFTSYDGKTKRLNSPGSVSVVPLLPGAEGGKYNFAITITATIKFYCPTIREQHATFSHSIPFPSVWPGEYLLRQHSPDDEPYFEMPTAHAMEHYRRIDPVDGAGFTAVVDGHACEFPISKMQPFEDILRFYIPQNLAILGNVYNKPKEITVTKFNVPKICHVTEILAN